MLGFVVGLDVTEDDAIDSKFVIGCNDGLVLGANVLGEELGKNEGLVVGFDVLDPTVTSSHI